MATDDRYHRDDRDAASTAAAELRIDRALERLWSTGWTPSDLLRVVVRQLGQQHAELTAHRAVDDGRRRAACGQALDPRWQRQLADLRARFGRVGSVGRPPLEVHLEVLHLVDGLPPIPPVMAPPGAEGTRSASAAGHLDAGMLARVRALLAKAESTEFEHEAEAFTAKAQELIARHTIDEALLHTVDDVGAPGVRRLPVDDPYADAKALLIAAVAAANRCRVIHSADAGWVTVFGYGRDLDALELLSASLLTQATTAMLRHGPRRDAVGRSRTRSFRRAFLLGFAQRIGERLRAATDAQLVATGDAGTRLAPVLAVRSDRLDAAVAAAFPRLISRPTSASNGSGWSAGRAAAEVADLGGAPRRLETR